MSQPWQDTLFEMIGSRKMNANSLLHYFQPIIEWLEADQAAEALTEHAMSQIRTRLGDLMHFSENALISDTTFALPVQLTVLTLQARPLLLVVAAPPRTAWHHPTTVEDNPLSLQPG